MVDLLSPDKDVRLAWGIAPRQVVVAHVADGRVVDAQQRVHRVGADDVRVLALEEGDGGPAHVAAQLVLVQRAGDLAAHEIGRRRRVWVDVRRRLEGLGLGVAAEERRAALLDALRQLRLQSAEEGCRLRLGVRLGNVAVPLRRAESAAEGVDPRGLPESEGAGLARHQPDVLGHLPVRVPVGVDDVVDVGHDAGVPHHAARVRIEGGEVVAHVGRLREADGRMQVDVRHAHRPRHRLVEVGGRQQPHARERVPRQHRRVTRPRVDDVGHHAEERAGVEADALGVLAHQAVDAGRVGHAPCRIEAVRIAVHVERLPPRVGLVVKVEVVLVQRRVAYQVAVQARRAKDVVADDHLAVPVLEARHHVTAELEHCPRPRLAARARTRCVPRPLPEEEPRAARLIVERA